MKIGQRVVVLVYKNDQLVAGPTARVLQVYGYASRERCNVEWERKSTPYQTDYWPCHEKGTEFGAVVPISETATEDQIKLLTQILR